MNAFALLSSDPGKARKDKPRKGKKKQAEETNTSKASVKDRSWGVEHDDGTFVAVRPRSQSKAKAEAVAQEKQVVGPSPASLEQAAATAKGSARLQLVQDWTTKLSEPGSQSGTFKQSLEKSMALEALLHGYAAPPTPDAEERAALEQLLAASASSTCSQSLPADAVEMMCTIGAIAAADPGACPDSLAVARALCMLIREEDPRAAAAREAAADGPARLRRLAADLEGAEAAAVGAGSDARAAAQAWSRAVAAGREGLWLLDAALPGAGEPSPAEARLDSTLRRLRAGLEARRSDLDAARGAGGEAAQVAAAAAKHAQRDADAAREEAKALERVEALEDELARARQAAKDAGSRRALLAEQHVKTVTLIRSGAANAEAVHKRVAPLLKQGVSAADALTRRVRLLNVGDVVSHTKNGTMSAPPSLTAAIAEVDLPARFAFALASLLEARVAALPEFRARAADLRRRMAQMVRQGDQLRRLGRDAGRAEAARTHLEAALSSCEAAAKEQLAEASEAMGALAKCERAERVLRAGETDSKKAAQKRARLALRHLEDGVAKLLSGEVEDREDQAQRQEDVGYEQVVNDSNDGTEKKLATIGRSSATPPRSSAVEALRAQLTKVQAQLAARESALAAAMQQEEQGAVSQEGMGGVVLKNTKPSSGSTSNCSTPIPAATPTAVPSQHVRNDQAASEEEEMPDVGKEVAAPPTRSWSQLAAAHRP